MLLWLLVTGGFMKLKVLALTLFAVGLVACGRDETAVPPASTTTVEQAGTSSPSDVNPVTAQTWLDDFTIGSELAPDGMMAAGHTGDDFTPGQPVHLSMEVGDAPPNSTVKVVWYGPNETKIGEENKPVVAGQKYLAFTAPDTKTWAMGDYKVETWIGDEKVNTQQFNLTVPSGAAK
jgi:hypothetical protein